MCKEPVTGHDHSLRVSSSTCPLDIKGDSEHLQLWSWKPKPAVFKAISGRSKRICGDQNWIFKPKQDVSLTLSPTSLLRPASFTWEVQTWAAYNHRVVTGEKLNLNISLSLNSSLYILLALFWWQVGVSHHLNCCWSQWGGRGVFLKNMYMQI